MKYYLNRKFVDHSADESSRILNNLTSLAYRVGHEIIEPTISLISRILFIIPIIIGMYLYNPKITLIGIIIFLFSYFIFFFFFRKIVEKFGKINTLNSKNKINLVEDFLGLFQDIKLNNLSFFYLKKLKKYNNTHIKINYVNSLISKSPKNIIEFIAFCVVIFLVIILYSRKFQFYSICQYNLCICNLYV